MPRLKVTRKEYATVVETTEVYIDIPEDRDPQEFRSEYESDPRYSEVLDLIHEEQEASLVQLSWGDPYLIVFQETENCKREYDWGCVEQTTSMEITE